MPNLDLAEKVTHVEGVPQLDELVDLYQKVSTQDYLNYDKEIDDNQNRLIAEMLRDLGEAKTVDAINSMTFPMSESPDRVAKHKKLLIEKIELVKVLASGSATSVPDAA